MRISDWSSDVCSSDLSIPRECARMPEAVSPQAVSPLRGHNQPRLVAHSAEEPGVTLTERRLVSLVQVAAWPDTVEAVTDTVASLLHCAPPQASGSSGEDRKSTR